MISSFKKFIYYIIIYIKLINFYILNVKLKKI